MNNANLVVVVGVGPGVGAAVAKAFAQKGHPLLLISRSATNLEELAGSLRRLGAAVTTAVADAATPGAVADVISQIEEPVSALVYNVAAFGGSLLTTDSVQIRAANEVNLLSLISATKSALPNLKAGSGMVLVTGGGFALHPNSDYGVLSVGKAMNRSASLLLAQELKPQHVRVATVIIAGTVAPGTPFDPDLIAQTYIQIFENADSAVETIFTGAAG